MSTAESLTAHSMAAELLTWTMHSHTVPCNLLYCCAQVLQLLGGFLDAVLEEQPLQVAAAAAASVRPAPWCCRSHVLQPVEVHLAPDCMEHTCHDI